MADVPIPASGWLRDTTDHPDDPAMTASLMAGIAPLAGWVYDAAQLARYHVSDLRIHPSEHQRLLCSLATILRYQATAPGDALLGCAVVVDPAVPEGIVRIAERDADLADALAYADHPDFDPAWRTEVARGRTDVRP